MKTFLYHCGAIALVVLVMFLKATYDMNKQCVKSDKYYSLNMELDCK